ncbi:MAG: nitrate reductase [Oscillospiraceae bacterium]|nr:nitrate reductase [Oscillospiraceae bacterium]
MKRIFIDADKCIGCKNCLVACMQAHKPGTVSVFGLDFIDPALESRNKILLDSRGKCIPLFCRHCDKPGCATACMSGAMVKEPETGYVRYDSDRCAQCFMCVMNCPYGVLKPDRETGTYVVKCDFCADHNSEPSCVKMCPVKAIYVEEV